MREERNSSPDLRLGTTVLATMGATALVAVLFLLSPWNVSHFADKSAPRAMTASIIETSRPVQVGGLRTQKENPGTTAGQDSRSQK